MILDEDIEDNELFKHLCENQPDGETMLTESEQSELITKLRKSIVEAVIE